MVKNNLSGRAAAVRSPLLNFGIALVLILAFSVVASAYTLVFRNGQRMEIPDEFTITKTTLTYEISPGFQKTILLSLIDIGATERANNEPWGSFFKRRQQVTVAPQTPLPEPSQPSTQATKTVTNSDLAAFRQRRIESERAYEQRRLQLGLPTVAESRRRQAQEEASLRDQLRERSTADKQEERYWRGRARELRTEIATVDNQINYVRGRLVEVSEASSVTGSWTSTYPLWPEYQWPRDRRWGRRDRRQNPPIFGPPQYPNRYPNGQYPPGQYPYGYPRTQYPYGYPPGQYPNGYPPGQYPNGYPTTQYPYGYPPGQYPYGYPTDPYGNPYPYGYPTAPYADAEKSAQQADLTRRLDDLLVRRAGLMAEWQALEDEARDARVPQVWLEP